ncbi:MAG TPA: nodulation protein NfeD [Pantanalinema sp.]
MRVCVRWLIALFFCLSALSGLSARAAGERVRVLEVKGAITPAIATYVARGLAEAGKAGDSAALIRLDTPGGLDSAMRDIVQAIEASRRPVIVYVSPQGGRAASAGVFITMAAHVAAMAPNTAIGAASPVASGGEEIKGTMKAKVTNDAAAYIRGIARSRGRNADWAEKAVRQAVSLESSEAVKERVVDLVAPDVPALLDRIDGRTVKVGGQFVALHTRQAQVVALEMGPLERFLQAISDPTIALLFLNLGMLGLFLELSNPGLILPGVIGGICLLLAFYALGTLPINAAGVALIAFAFLLFVAELFVPSFGALAVGGVVSLVLGALMLVSPGTPGFEVSRGAIAGIALLSGCAIAALVTMAVRAQRRRVTTGKAGMVGAIARVRTPLEPEGQVFVNGELWRAVSLEGPVPVGAAVEIRRVEHLTLFVVPTSVNPASLPQEAPSND